MPSTGVALSVIGWGRMLLRQRTTRRRAEVKLRDQIARDLHVSTNAGAVAKALREGMI